MNRKTGIKSGLSMIELLIGVTIFGLAMVPLMWLGTTQTRGAFSIGKHMMAGQIAASFLDRLHALPYEKCLEAAQALSQRGRLKVLDNEELQKTLEAVNDEGIQKDMETSFRYFFYKFDHSVDDSARILRLNLEVFYRVEEGTAKSEQSVRLSVLKHGARNG